MLDPMAISLGVLLTLIVVAFHFMQGSEQPTAPDISEDILERRAATVLETGFPEPMNRAIGGSAVTAPAIAAGGGAEGELVEGQAEPEAAPSPSDIPEDEIEIFEIEFLKEGSTIEVANNETLLEAGEDEGWDLPYACREGDCLSCGAHIDGDGRELVVHDDQTMLDDDELSQGYILSCVAYPQSSFSIETRETP